MTKELKDKQNELGMEQEFDLRNYGDSSYFYHEEEAVSIRIVGWEGDLYTNCFASELQDLRLPKDYIKVYINLHKLDPCVVERVDNSRYKLHYVTCSGCLPTSKVVTGFKRLFIDYDCKNPNGYPATNAERQYTYDISLLMLPWFEQQYGFANPTIGMSGNGTHHLYLLPENWVNIPEYKARYKSILKAAQGHFNRSFPEAVKKGVTLDAGTYLPTQWMKFWCTEVHSVRKYTKEDFNFDYEEDFNKFMLGKTKYEELKFESDDPDKERIPSFCFIIQLGAWSLTKKESDLINKLTVKRHHYVRPIRRICKENYPVEAILDKHNLAYNDPVYDPGSDCTLWKLADGCVFNHNHKDASIIYRNGMPRPKYKCFHQSCSEHGWVDFLISVGGYDHE